MPHDFEPQTFLVLLSVAIALLALCFLALLMIGGRLSRIERVLRNQSDSAPEAGKRASTTDEKTDGAFAKFLAERPELLELKKGEQFAAFRKWRKEQGLNWEGR